MKNTENGLEAIKEYNKKVQSGEIKRTKSKDPMEKFKEDQDNGGKSLRKRINAKCFDCVCEQRTEITKCTIEECPLWDVRPYQP